MNPTALVTGCSRGLGAHVARRLVADGWDVVGVARTPMESPDGVRQIVADLGDDGAIATILQEVDDVPDLVVHCAVGYPGPSPSPAEIERVFRVNALAPYLLTLELIPRAAGRHRTCVVVNSEAIFSADGSAGVYAASKAALRVFTAALSHQCASSPMSVSTLLLGPLADGKVDELRRVAERRGITTEEATKLFLSRSNPNLVISSLLEHESCYTSVRYIASLGAAANGMMCRLDGGSAGSLI